MNFERYYSKLPKIIKYNSFVYKFSLKLSKILRKMNQKNNQLNSHNELLNLLFTSSDIKITGILRDVQLLYVELLRFIDNVCAKHDIDYWIDYGTLLGAYRHGGFIPWDDDLDISIMRKDYEKLIRVLPEEIKKYPVLRENCGLSLLIEGQKNYFKEFKSVYDVEDSEKILNDDKYSFLQIALMKPYIKIDIFPKDYINENELDKYLKNYEIEKYRFNKNTIFNCADFFNTLNEEKRKLGQCNDETKICANSLDHIILEHPVIFEVENIFPLKTIKFEDYYFKCPNNIPEHLKAKFGSNYMRIPRIIENHDLLKFIETQFSSVDEQNKSFEDSLNYLKKINAGFK